MLCLLFLLPNVLVVFKSVDGLVVSGVAHLEFELGDPGSIPRSCHYLRSNLGQVVYSHCLPSFSAPRK